MVGATGPGALDEDRGWRRMAVIATPWGLALLLGLLGVMSARGTAGESPATPGMDSGEIAPVDEAVNERTPTGRQHSTAGATTPSLPAGVELAVLTTARAAMGTAGLVAGEAGDRWPVATRISSVQAVTAEHAVATVHGLVIQQTDDGWRGPHPRAVAVLLRMLPSTAVVGQAWPLAEPSTPTASPDLHPVDDPDPSILASLDEAGWSIEEVIAVDASDDALLRVALRGAPPGDRPAGDHVVWLLDAPGGPRLLPLAAGADSEEQP